ncbi:DUF3291 domain-containing protein [Fibrella forsythiae]|uniref:DUF3291 domain-containing protein n=1 Tax=Fibrella forsythiae TaxID=2817061 RepID=UPI001E34ED3D|nr:DUF3291 domain-containing protein [Fibrella forsythiae]
MPYQLAQLNIGRLLAPIDAPLIAECAAQLDEINALAERNPGFKWRLKGEGNDATSLHPFSDELIIVTMSVWELVDTLKNFAFKSAHSAVTRRRTEWFGKFHTAYLALWWIEAGHVPTIDEARARLRLLDKQG